MDTDNISKLISGKCISYIEAHKDRELAIVFVDGSALLVKRLGQGLSMDFVPSKVDAIAAKPFVRPYASVSTLSSSKST